MINKNNYRLFLMAFLGHLLLTVTVTWAIRPVESISSKQSSVFIPAFIYHAPQISLENSAHRLQDKIVSKHGLEKTLVKTLSKSSPQTSKPADYSHQYTSEKNIAKPLLKLLHDATAANLIYPDVAIELNEIGRVEIGFLLSPAGGISEVKLLNSSGYDLLDNAALDAVKAMSPVGQVDRYIKQPTLLAVDVVFK